MPPHLAIFHFFFFTFFHAILSHIQELEELHFFQLGSTNVREKHIKYEELDNNGNSWGVRHS